MLPRTGSKKARLSRCGLTDDARAREREMVGVMSPARLYTYIRTFDIPDARWYSEIRNELVTSPLNYYFDEVEISAQQTKPKVVSAFTRDNGNSWDACSFERSLTCDVFWCLLAVKRKRDGQRELLAFFHYRRYIRDYQKRELPRISLEFPTARTRRKNLPK